jgi:hypothetical protein
MDKKESTYIDGVVERAFSFLQNPDQRTAFAKALMMSVRLDRSGSTPPAPFSPREINQECKIALKLQKEFKLILNKADALEFLKNFGLVQLSDSSFKKRHTVLSYKEFFGRDPGIINQRNLVCTYAEWLYLEEFPFEPLLPETIYDYLPDPNWRPTREPMPDVGASTTFIAQISLIDSNIPSEVSHRVRSSIQQFMSTLGADLDGAEEAVHGSFFQELRFKFRGLLSPQQISEVFETGKEALKAGLNKSSIESTGQVAEAASQVIQSLEGISDAVIRLGKLVVVKYTEKGKITIIAETISLELQNRLDNDPNILRNPKAVINLLNSK